MSTAINRLPALGAVLCFLGSVSAIEASTDGFGSPGHEFQIEFVRVANPGNGGDAGAAGYGEVSYDYRVGLTEVPQDWITKALNSGLSNVTAGPWTGASRRQTWRGMKRRPS